MIEVTLGKTGITVNKNGFGALPIQRITKEDAVKILYKAYDNGIKYFDTARAYSDSEEKLGYALSSVRKDIFLATKSHATIGKKLREDLETSLKNLRTDYIDVYQFHNPDFVPKPGGEDGLYDEALKAKKEGKIRFISITNHRFTLATEAVESGLYDTLQFPFSYLASDEDLKLMKKCVAANMGFIAMKGLAGGLINSAKAAYTFMAEHEGVLPIWGVQREKELDDFLALQNKDVQMVEEVKNIIEKDRKELIGGFCRGCGYCLPCPAGIDIPLAARMSLMLRRAPVKAYTTPEIQENMKKIETCIHCNHCKNHCPYGLDTPTLLQENYADFKTFIR